MLRLAATSFVFSLLFIGVAWGDEQPSAKGKEASRDLKKKDEVWNGLEITKLIISALTPLIVFYLGIRISYRLKEIEHRQWANQQLIEKRLAVYDELVPLLNDIMCYFAYIGCWKELVPPQVVAGKRRVDRIAYINAPVFPSEFLIQYNQFIHLCYKTFRGWGKDAQLRTETTERQKAAGATWDAKWNSCFDTKDYPKPDEVRHGYAQFVAYMSEAVGVGIKADNVLPGE